MKTCKDGLLRTCHSSVNRSDFGFVTMARKALDGKRRKRARRHAIGCRSLLDFRMKFSADAPNSSLSDVSMNAGPDDLFNLHSTILCALAAGIDPGQIDASVAVCRPQSFGGEADVNATN